MTTIRSDGGARRSARRAAVVAAFLANGLGIGSWAASLPILRDGAGVSDGALSWALTAFAVGATAAMPIAGTVAPRWGAGRATWITGAAFAIALALPRFAGDLAGLTAAAFLLGAANGALDVSMNARASEVEAEYGRPIMSSFHAAFSVGGLIGAALGAVLALREPGAVLWMPAAVAAILVLGFAPDLGRGERTASGEGPRFALPGRAAVGLSAIALVSMMIEGATADWSAVYIAGHSVGPAAPAALGYVLFSLTMTGGRLGGDRLIGAWGAERAARRGGAAAAFGLILAALLPGWGAAIGFGLVGAGLANLVPVVFSAAGRLGPSAASGVATVATAGYAGLLSGPPIVGAIATVFSLRGAIALLAAAALLIVVLAPRAVGRLGNRARGA